MSEQHQFSSPTYARREPDGRRYLSKLTPFEEHILELVAHGMRRREIARRLRRAPQTISNSLTLAKDKLGARTVAEAAALLTERRG